MTYLRQTYLSCELLDLSFNRISRCLVSKIFSLFVSLSNIWNKTQAESNFSHCGNIGALSVFETSPKLFTWQRWNVHHHTKEGLRKQIRSRRQISRPQNLCCSSKKYIFISAQRAFQVPKSFSRNLTPNPHLNPSTIALVVFGTTHIFLSAPILLSVSVNKLVSNNVSKDRSFQWYLVLDSLTNPDIVTLRKKGNVLGENTLPISLFTRYSLKINFGFCACVKKLFNYVRLVGKYAFFLAKLVFSHSYAN